MTNEKLQKQATAIIASGLMEKTNTGYIINRPSFRGRGMGEPFRVENGKCGCYDFSGNGECVHTIAVAQIAAAQLCEFCGKDSNGNHWDCELGITEAVEAARKKESLEAAKAKVVEILSSNHVARVEVGFEYEAGNTRYYTAVTKETGIPHRYRVRVEDSFETGERVAVAKCNCSAGAKGMRCRHVAAVAKKDSARMEREIYPHQLAGYQAHKRAA